MDMIYNVLSFRASNFMYFVLLVKGMPLYTSNISPPSYAFNVLP